MRKLVVACVASLLVYALLFASVLDRPLTLGFLRLQLDAKLQRGASITGAKLVILAGSNGPYSHRCEVIEPLLGLPCINGGVAVGIGLDYLFARWEPELHPGDTVYLPMEETQYTRGRLASALGPDAAIMFRHDWATLAKLTPERWAAAAFAFDLRALLMSLIEQALVAGGFHDPRAEMTGSTNAWGDHVGHTATRGAASRGLLAILVPQHATAEEIRDGYGTELIAGFLAWAASHCVRVIGGVPTNFDDAPIPDATVAAMRSVYLGQHAQFLELPNESRYPRAAFFDTPEHLNELGQVSHSVMLARELAKMLERSAKAETASAAHGDHPRCR
jgi:hypothetical protein